MGNIFLVSHILLLFYSSAKYEKLGKYWHIYTIMETMYPPGYHHNGFMETHALGHTCIHDVHDVQLNVAILYDDPL